MLRRFLWPTPTATSPTRGWRPSAPPLSGAGPAWPSPSRPTTSISPTCSSPFPCICAMRLESHELLSSHGGRERTYQESGRPGWTADRRSLLVFHAQHHPADGPARDRTGTGDSGPEGGFDQETDQPLCHGAAGYADRTLHRSNRRVHRGLSLIHISEPTRLRRISYAVFCLKKKNK